MGPFDHPLRRCDLGLTGDVAAMADRCPHRFAPLSLGTRDDDNVVCGYHGLTFAPDGQCVRNPFSERIPSTFRVRTYTALERDGIVWLWLGEPEAAYESRIPDFGFLPDTAASRSVHGYTLMQANYEYGTDNLLDLSHIEFVHKGTFAGLLKLHHQLQSAARERWAAGEAKPVLHSFSGKLDHYRIVISESDLRDLI